MTVYPAAGLTERLIFGGPVCINTMIFEGAGTASIHSYQTLGVPNDLKWPPNPGSTGPRPLIFICFCRLNRERESRKS